MVDVSNLKPGAIFDTVFTNQFGEIGERGCIVRTEPDEFGSFIALDSEGIECQFSTAMVTHIWPSNSETFGN